MSVYTVHAPPSSGAAARPEDFVFVRDGFHFWAFVFPPIWMLLHRLWLVFLVYAVATVGLQAVLMSFGAGGALTAAIAVLLSLLVGLEAGALYRFGLTRRGWRSVGHVIGDNLEAAEHRFFESWSASQSAARAAAPAEPAVPTVSALTAGLRPRSTSSGVIGLFPEPGEGR